MDVTASSQTMRIELPVEARPGPKTGRIPRAVRKAVLPAQHVRNRLGPAEVTLYNEFMQSIYDAVVITDMAGNIVDGNIRAIEFFQHEIPELCALTVFDIVSGFNPPVLATIRDNLDQQRFTLIAAYGRRKDQSLFPVEIAPSQIHVGGEAHLGFFIRDVTKRAQAEAALRESEQRFKTIFDNAADGILLVDPQSIKISLANKTICAMLDYTAAELAAMEVADIHPAEDLPYVLEQFEKQVRREIKIAESLPVKRKDGSVFYADVSVFYITLEDKTYMAGMFRDITERKQAAEYLQKTRAYLERAERLEMAGSIAGHIAHDFNNLLTPILVYPDLISEHLPPNSPALEDLMIIKKTAQVMADINQQLLATSRRGYHEQAALNINAIISDASDLVSRGQQLSGIAIKLELAEDLLNMKGTYHQLVRLLQNLCQNSIDAMNGKGGTLTLRAENVYLDAPLKKYESVAVGEYVKVTVSDTGHGIPQDIRERIFEPFFTTKSTSGRRGCGLGLSVVHGIVKDHNGYIDIESAVGMGTVFSLYFPTCREEIPVLIEEQLHGGKEKLLIVDDDALQIEVVSRLAAKLGYTVISARSGEEAVNIIRACQDENRPFPDLVILDMVMRPDMNGAQTYKRIKAINPDQKAIILSGYEESSKVTQTQAMGAGAFVRKPVDLARLARAIRDELDRAP